MKPILEIKGISKKFRIHHEHPPYLSLRDSLTSFFHDRSKVKDEDFWALQNISFTVEQGESIGIIGKNGAGKSTLLKVLSKITPPTSGKIISRGRIASLLEVGTGFHAELSGRENIFLNGCILGMKRKEIQSKFDEIVDFSGVERFLDTPLKHFSSGMQLRLAFAVAAFLEPEILLIDEVLAVGDSEFQKKCLGKMEDVTKNEGRTILFVSHNMQAFRKLCSRGIFLKDGKKKLDDVMQICISAYLGDNLELNEEKNKSIIEFPDSHGEMSIVRATIFCNNQPHSRLHMGQSLQFGLDIKCSIPIKEPRIGFVVSNSEGVAVLNANNRYQLTTTSSSSYYGEVSALCDLGKVTLEEGKYYVTLFLGNDSTDFHVIQSAFSFEVISEDVYGMGVTPPKGISMFWWPTSFNIHQKKNSKNVTGT